MAKTVNAAPVKLKLLITVVNKSKADFYADLIQSFEVNLQFLSLARGTALADVMNYLGLSDSEKAVVFSVVREDRLDDREDELRDDEDLDECELELRPFGGIANPPLS